MTYYTYRITNLKLNKHYYGARSTEVNPSEDLGIVYFSTSTDKEFIEDQKENPQDYIYKIIKVFDSMKEAISLEVKLHARFNVKLHEKFYNRANQTSSGFDRTGMKHSTSGETRSKISEGLKRHYNIPGNREQHSANLKGKMISWNKGLVGVNVGWTHSEETKRKISNANLGKKRTVEQRLQFSEAHMGNRHSEETKRKISNSRKGHSVSEETRKKISSSNKGYTRSEESKRKQSESLKAKPKVTCPHCDKQGAKSIMSRHHFDNCESIIKSD